MLTNDAAKMQQSETLRQLTPYDRIGGLSAVQRLVEAFYRHMESLPQAQTIRALHSADLTSTKSVLALYLGEWLGGPSTYSETKGHPRLRMRHLRFAIGIAERDAWLLCMNKALEDVVQDAHLRAQLFASFTQTADWLRNDPGNPHDNSR